MLRRSLKLAAAALGACFVLGPGPAGSIVLTPYVQKRLGVATTPLAPARRAAEVDAFAKVLDPEPLVQLDSDLATAEAAAVASRAEARRAAALRGEVGGVSTKDLETATAQARADALKVDMLRRRLALEWGPGVARMSDADRGRLTRALTAGSAALVHVDTHNDVSQAGARRVRIDLGEGSMEGLVVGPARAAEPRLQSSGLIVKVTGPSAVLLSVGLTQSAHIEGKIPRGGVLVPQSGVIRFEGSDWVYVRLGATTFQRRLIQNPVPDLDGYFVVEGLAPGEAVVTAGAGALFAAEQGAAGPNR